MQKVARRRMAMAAAILCLNQAFAQDRWTDKDLVAPEAIAARLEHRGGPAPVILFVGFPVLYRGAHVPGALLAGPDSKPEGMEALRKAVQKLPSSAEIVIYCGCCPFVKCPNVRPAYDALRAMGFKHVKVMELDTNFHSDWVAKGYPVERAS